jgi:hypothetical protein
MAEGSTRKGSELLKKAGCPAICRRRYPQSFPANSGDLADSACLANLLPDYFTGYFKLNPRNAKIDILLS